MLRPIDRKEQSVVHINLAGRGLLARQNHPTHRDTQLGTGLTTPQREAEPDPGGQLVQMTSDPPSTEQGTDTGGAAGALLEALTSVSLGRCIFVSW